MIIPRSHQLEIDRRLTIGVRLGAELRAAEVVESVIEHCQPLLVVSCDVSGGFILIMNSSYIIHDVSQSCITR